MKKLRLLLVFEVIFLATFLACKKEQPDFNKEAKDPCACASEVSADFVIEERATHIPQEIWVETDTTLHNKNVRFRALEDDAEYTWYIGMDIETDQAPSKYFSDDWIGYDIPITLVVKKEPNNTCFPDDDGYDSITKTFYVSQYPIYHGTNENIEMGTIDGYYRVFSTEVNDSIDIHINIVDRLGFHAVSELKNIDGSGVECTDNFLRIINYRSYREVKFNASHTDSSICAGISGRIQNKINGEAELNFIISRWEGWYSNVYETEFQYFGRKLSN